MLEYRNYRQFATLSIHSYRSINIAMRRTFDVLLHPYLNSSVLLIKLSIYLSIYLCSSTITLYSLIVLIILINSATFSSSFFFSLLVVTKKFKTLKFCANIYWELMVYQPNFTKFPGYFRA